MAKDPDFLRRKADRFEDLAGLITDSKALQALRDLARAWRRVGQVLSRTRLGDRTSGPDDTEPPPKLVVGHADKRLVSGRHDYNLPPPPFRAPW